MSGIDTEGVLVVRLEANQSLLLPTRLAVPSGTVLDILP